MRFRVVQATFLALLAMLGAAVPASAQSFLQQLFGFGGSAPAQSAPPQNQMTTPGGRAYTMPGSVTYGAQMSRRQSNDADDDHDQRGSGSYKTICVRMCDGFFFPISNNTSKKGLYRDQMKCRSQCGDEGRLFYLPAKSTEVDGAVDLQGRVYGRLNTAYVYRKTLVAGCQCKADPWADSEIERHRQYAETDSEKKVAPAPRPDQQIADAEAVVPKDSPEQIAKDVGAAKPKQTTRTASVKPAPKFASIPRPLVQQASAKSTPFGGGMGLGGGQLTWPGDAPRRP